LFSTPFTPPPTLAGHTAPITTINFAPSSTTFASGGEDRIVRIGDAEKSSPLQSLPFPGDALFTKYPDQFTAIAYSPDNALVALGNADRTIRVINIKTNRLVRQLVGHTGAIRALAFSPDGLLLASASADKTARIWRVGDSDVLHSLGKHDTALASVAFSADGKKIATASADGKINLWQIENATWLREMKHPGEIIAITFRQDQDNLLLLSLNRKRNLRHWQVSDGKQIATLYPEENETVQTGVFSHTGLSFATADPDHKIRVWSAVVNPQAITPTPVARETPPPPVPNRILAGHTEPITALAFEANDRRLISGAKDKTLRVWNLFDGSLTKTFQHDKPITALDVRHLDNLVAFAAEDKFARTWNSTSNQATMLFQGHDDAITHIAVSPDANHLIAITRGGIIRRWRVDDKTMLRELIWDAGEITSVAIHPTDSNRAAIGNANGVVRFYQFDQSAFQEIPFAAPITSLAYNSDGAILAVGNLDQKIILLKERARVHEIEPAGAVTQLRFSPDNKFLAAAVSTGAMRAWQFEPGVITPTRALDWASDKSVVDLAFSADGATLATAHPDRVRVWNAADGALIDELPSYARAIHALTIISSDAIFVAGEAGLSYAIQTWYVGNVKEMREPITQHSLHKWLIRSALLRVWWSFVIGLLVAGGIVATGVALSGLTTARVLQSEHPETTRAQLWRWAVDVELGVHKIEQLVAGGEVKILRPASGDLARFGGPGVLIVEEGHAVVLQQSGRVTNVVGNGITWLKPFERVSMVVYLSPRSEPVVVENVATQDKMMLDSFELMVFHKTDPGERTNWSGQIPFDPKLIIEKIWSPKGGDWREAVKGMSQSVVRDYVAQYTFADILAISGADRDRLVHDLKERINVNTKAVLGVEVVAVNLGTIRISKTARQVLEEKILAEIRRQSKVIDAEADKEALARKGEGEALKFRRVEQERTSLRREYFQQLLDPLLRADGKPLDDAEVKRRYLHLIEKFLDIEALDKISHADGQKTFIVGDTKGYSGTTEEPRRPSDDADQQSREPAGGK
jgi:WD40 repeat protein/regulator of protease activity HflC (stomatin/prohibitin superfamily)